MLESDLQSYLFAHPEILFPSETVLEKAREFCIGGKRIDLLLRTQEARYIIELKSVPLTREHIGQVVEYYGLMRESMKDGNFKMILVAPSIPDFRKIFLEEMGIRCVEIPAIPSEAVEIERLAKDASAHRKREHIEAKISKWIPDVHAIRYDDLVTSVTKQSLAISHRLFHDSLPDIQKALSEYVIRPIKMMRAESADMICQEIPASLDSMPPFVRGGAWWAYAFGDSEEMPKNDLPNISSMVMPWCLDLAINAELLPSQSIMKARIAEESLYFDELICQHGGLQLQVLLKLEHQPRFYHWVPLISEKPGSWTSKSFLEACARMAGEYDKDSWVERITKNQSKLSGPQMQHMRVRNKQPNLALRLVRPFRREDQLWSLPYRQQCELFVSECRRLKPLIDFLR